MLPAPAQNVAQKTFAKAANQVSKVVGSPYWFFFSILLVLLWIPTGFWVGWGDTWQLIINTSTTILTFLMMSLLHASQSKWEQRMEDLQIIEQKKLDEIRKSEHTEIEKISSLT